MASTAVVTDGTLSITANPDENIVAVLANDAAAERPAGDAIGVFSAVQLTARRPTLPSPHSRITAVWTGVTPVAGDGCAMHTSHTREEGALKGPHAACVGVRSIT